jgi:hypothetical protein
MRRVPDHRFPAPRTLIGVFVPADEVELRKILGWRLGDDPACGNVRMIPPAPPVLAEVHSDGS